MAKQAKRSSFIKLLLAGLVVLVVLGGGIAAIRLTGQKHFKEEVAARASALKEGPVVKTSLARYNLAPKEIVLIGEARPYESSTIYAKISGYLDRILVDKGDRVVKDQVLATIVNPEIDQQYNAAKADLENKKKIFGRDVKLFAKNYISEEDADQSETAVKVAEATLRSLAEQQQYKTLRAPFSGTVTARFADPGALIQNAINAQTSAQPVVTVSTLDRLRVFVYAEQKDAALLKTGYPAEITLTENPELKIRASVSRIAGALDEHTRMMLVELDIDNSGQKIIPGSYVQVHITGPKDKNARIEVPSNALVFHKDKSMVAVIGADTAVHFKVVKVGENSGEKITILEGIENGERVALNVGESLSEGQRVRIEQ